MHILILLYHGTDRFYSATSSTTPRVNFTYRKPPVVLPGHGDSTSMLLRWVHDTGNVTVNEKLYGDAFQGRCDGSGGR
jgi:hypothetical protein